MSRRESWTVQRRPKTGCIPWAYENMLRAVGAEGIDLDAFQEDFDFDKDKGEGEHPSNNFRGIASAVRMRYPEIVFEDRVFARGDGRRKLEFVREQLARGGLVLVALNVRAFGHVPREGEGVHIVPVVGFVGDLLTVIHHVEPGGGPVTCEVRAGDLVQLHDAYEGGHDVAYLRSWT